MKRKTIRLYHGTSKQFTKINLGKLISFSEGVGLYSTKDLTYAMTYTSIDTSCSASTNSLVINDTKTTAFSILHPSSRTNKTMNRVFYFDCPIDFINSEEDKHIKFIDFYSLERSLGLEFTDIKSINFNQSDFQVFSEIMESALMYATDTNCRQKIMKKGFAFMNKFGYNVIEVKQFNRHMTDRFYLIVNYNLIKKGNYYEVGEF